jgi:uncharacterized protein YgiM (DUF1202 family)
LGEVNANNINVRCDSTPNSEVIYTLNKGVRVEVVREFFEWYKIRLLKTAPSYIKKRFVACLDETAQPVCRNARVINDRVNVRLKPSESSAILGKADKTDPVVILEQEKGWYKIEPIAKSFGWINKKFVNKLAETEEKTE